MAQGPAKGIGRWLFTTNHKDIGTMYLWFSFAMFILGGAFAMIIRAELFQPGMQLVEPAFFNQMTTLHGLVMVFGAIMPSFVGLANWLLPMMIGAPGLGCPASWAATAFWPQILDSSEKSRQCRSLSPAARIASRTPSDSIRWLQSGLLDQGTGKTGSPAGPAMMS